MQNQWAERKSCSNHSICVNARIDDCRLSAAVLFRVTRSNVVWTKVRGLMECSLGSLAWWEQWAKRISQHGWSGHCLQARRLQSFGDNGGIGFQSYQRSAKNVCSTEGMAQQSARSGQKTTWLHGTQSTQPYLDLPLQPPYRSAADPAGEAW